MANRLLQNGLVITFIHEGYHSIKMKYADLYIQNGQIVEIAEHIAARPGDDVVDLRGKWILPGLVNLGSHCLAAKLANGLLPDYPRHNWQGSMAYHRTLPLLSIAERILSQEEKETFFEFALFDARQAGSTTLCELCPAGFSEAFLKVAQKLGMRGKAVTLQMAGGFPVAAQDGTMLYQKPQGKAAFSPRTVLDPLREEFSGLYSLETTSIELYEAAQKALPYQPLFIQGAYSQYEAHASAVWYGKRPLAVLKDQGLLERNTILLDPVYTDFFDRERLRTAGTTVSLSAVDTMQDALSFEAVTFLRQDVSTALHTGYFTTDFLQEMRCAAFGAKRQSENAAQYGATDAFYGATISGAQALGESLGRIEVEFAADLLVVDPARFVPNNYPLISFVYAAIPTDIERVMIGGEWVGNRADYYASLHDFQPKIQKIADKVWKEARKTVL